MHPMLASCVFLLATASSLASAAATPLDVRSVALPPGVERAWLEKDVELIARTRDALPPSGSARAFFAPFRDVGTTDLGFGYARRTVTVGGGYTSCSTTGVSHDDALLELHTACWSSTNPETRRAIEPTLTAAFGPGWTHDASARVPTWEVTHAFPAAQATARAALDAELGPLAPVDVAALPADVAKAYATLSSAREDVVVGDHCGFAGVTPPEKAAADVLVAAHRADLLRNVLRGPSPGARVYAARALAAMSATTPADAAIVTKLAAQPIAITTCHGCIRSEVSSQEALASTP